MRVAKRLEWSALLSLLLGLLASAVSAVRAEDGRPLCEVDPPPAELSPEAKALVEKLQSKDVEVRRTAATDLGKLNEKATVPALIEALNDKDVQVRVTAAVDLQKLADRSAIPALVKRVADNVGEDDDNWGAGRSWAWGMSKDAALAALKDLDKDRVTAALAAGLKAKNEHVRIWACGALSGQKDDKSATEALNSATVDKLATVRRAAAAALGELGEPSAGPALITALEDDDATVRTTAAVSLQKASKRGDKDAVAALVKRVADDIGEDDDNWGAGRSWAWGMSKDAALAALKDLDKDRVTAALAAGLKAKNEHVRIWACGALGGTEDKDAVEPLVQGLNDKLPTVRLAAATALGTLAEESAGPALILALGDKNFSVRSAAAASLAKAVKKGDKDAVAALVKRVADDIGEDDDNWGAGRNWAWGVSKDAALAALKVLDKNRMTEALTAAALKSKNDRTRAWACLNLGAQTYDEKAAADALAQALTDKTASVRTAAAAGLQKLDDKDIVPALVKRVADDVLDGDPADKNAALAALKALDPDKVKGALTTATQSTNAAVKDWAVAQLAALKDPK